MGTTARKFPPINWMANHPMMTLGGLTVAGVGGYIIDQKEKQQGLGPKQPPHATTAYMSAAELPSGQVHTTV